MIVLAGKPRSSQTMKVSKTRENLADLCTVQARERAQSLLRRGGQGLSQGWADIEKPQQAIYLSFEQWVSN
jgi:hypothetical protein